MKKPFFARYGLLLLMAVFFLAPFGLRGARLAVQRMKNDVKDWLPEDFAETEDLDWFREHFLGEQFVVLSWEGCTGRVDDHRFMSMVDGFFPEVPPSERARRLQQALQPNDAAAEQADSDGEPNVSESWPVAVDRQDFMDEELGMYVRQLEVGDLPDPSQRIGNQLGLYYEPNQFTDWGGQREKWIRGRENKWYFLLPNGDLYRWDGASSMVQPILEQLARWIRGPRLEGRLVASLGPVDGPWYYEDPNRLSAWLFKTVTTGPGVLHQLTKDGAVLQDDVGLAMTRLSGTLFGEPYRPDADDDRAEPIRFDSADPEAGQRPLETAARQTCLVVTLTEAAKAELQLALGRGILGKPRGQILEIAEQAGVHPPKPPSFLPPVIDWMLPEPETAPVPQLRMGGPSVDNVAIDEEGQITLVRLVGLSVLVGLGLSWFSFRSFNLTIMVFLVGGLSAVASLSFVYWGGSSVDAVLMSMPSLVYVLGLSGAVHIVNYYRDSIRQVGLRHAPGHALRVGWKPCTLAAVTTALGLVSLNTSHIAPIEKFGLFAALGVLATLVLLFTYLPAALQTWPPRRLRRRERKALEPSRFERWVVRFWHGVGELVLKHYAIAFTCCAITMVVVGYGLRHINTDVQLLKMFDQDAKIIQDYRWLEANLGKLVPMELVVQVQPSALRHTTGQSDASQQAAAQSAPPSSSGPSAGGDRPADNELPTADASGELAVSAPQAERLQALQTLTFLERMEIVHYIEQVLTRQFGEAGTGEIGTPMSATTFSVEMPSTGGSLSSIAERGGISRQLEAHRDEFLASDYVRVDQDTNSELWRISLRLAALSDIDYGRFVESLKRSIEPVVAAYAYRRQILAALAEQQGVDGVRKSSIYMVGVPWGRSQSAQQLTAKAAKQLERNKRSAAATESGDRETTDRVADSAAQSVPQTTIFATILGRLLRNAGLTLNDWYDPRFQPPDDWSDALRDEDCVVVVDVESPTIKEQLKAVSPILIDATDHRFQPDRRTTHEQEAAWQTQYTTTSNGGTTTHSQQLERPVSVVYTGLVPVVYKAQRTLLESLIVSTAWAFCMIAVVMVFVVRSGPAGLLSMIPNVFPVLVIFGAMGWLGILVDIGSMMTASVAMGVAVDDTIHFLTWFRRGLDDGKSRRGAILQAYERVGMAMTQTTLIGGFGLSIFAFSTFTPTQRFGMLMLTLLAAALVGDLIFLPALLASPIGRVFDGPKRHRKRPATRGESPAAKSAGPEPMHDSRPTPHRTHYVPTQRE